MDRLIRRIGIDASRTVRVAAHAFSICRAPAGLCAEQAVLLLEFLQPARRQYFLFALGTTCAREKACFFLDHFIAKREALALVVPCPIGKCLLDIGDSALGPFDGRSTSIIGVEIFLFLAQDFGNGAVDLMLGPNTGYLSKSFW